MNTIPDNTRMKTNNEAAVMPTNVSEDKSEKRILMTKQYTQTNSLYMYRRSLNIIEEAVREVIPCVKKSVNKSFIRVKILKNSILQ